MTYQNSLIERKNKLIKWLKEKRLPGCLIQDPVNLFYYTGLHLSAGVLVITPQKQFLAADFRYAARCEKESIYSVKGAFSLPKALDSIHFPKKMVVDGDCLTLTEAKFLRKYTQLTVKSGFLMDLRKIKDAFEIKKIQKACEITAKSYAYIQKYLKEGVTEKEIAFLLEQYSRKLGAEKMSFDTIVAFGKNSANPHYTPGNIKLKKNDIILLDSGCVYEGYCSDMTRTYIKGKVSPKYEKIYKLTEEIQKKAIELCQVGIPLKKIHQAVIDFYEEHKVRDLFIHGLGHGVGVEIHEAPRYVSKGKIEPGLILTVEPGLYIEGLGGVRIEDTILTTETGPQILTQFS